MLRRSLMVGLLFALALPLWAAPNEKAMERPSVAFDRSAHFREMFDLQDRLNKSKVGLAAEAPIRIDVSPADIDSVRSGMMQERKMRVGLVKEFEVGLNFSREDMIPEQPVMHESFGALKGAHDGTFVWTGIVQSPGASAVRIHFADFDLPEDSELYVFTLDGMAFGPYTGRGPNGTGDFWSNTVSGPEIFIQLHGGEIGAPRFTVAGLGHMTGDFKMAENLLPRMSAMATKPCSFNANCVVDAACTSTNTAVNTAKNAVAHILFASGAYLYICSGGLVADSVSTSNIPYFVTANHCISRSSEASSMETFFFYTAGSCGSCPDPGAASTTGSSIVASGRTSDYTILRLSQNAPSGAAFLGWTSTAVANTNGTALFRISHPKGAPQSYSTQSVDTSKGTCQSWPRGAWIYSRDTLGATEGGSSGSPVVNGAGQLVGQLSGACGFNVNDVCDSQSNATVDGAFANYYPSVSSILGSGGGGGGCTDADGDGVCASQGDCNDNNKDIHPGHSEKGKWGRDGVDNDCDGIIDA